MLIVPLVVAACGGGGADEGAATTAVDGAVVQPGLASCLAAIGREDVARNPDAEMSASEAYALAQCVGERASR